MASKGKSSSKKQPHTSERILSAPPGILRRPPFAPAAPVANYTTPIHDPRIRNLDYNNGIPVPYANILPGGSTSHCIPGVQSLQYPFYNRDGMIPEDESTNEDIEDQEEEEQIAEIGIAVENTDVIGENTSSQDHTEPNADAQIEYVKLPVESKPQNRKASHRLTQPPGSVPKTMSHYDSRIIYNMAWQNPDNVPTFQTQLNTGEAIANVVDPRTIENPNAYQPRKNPFPYQGTDPNKVQNVYNYSVPEKNTDAWIKYQEALKKASQSHSTCRKAAPTQKIHKPCVGADDSTKLEGIEQILGEMEHHEMTKIKKDLKDFQKARRRLIYDASNIKPLFYYPPKQ
ncbi:hypothetical protein Trydic_g17734 [Trypoxylus dichotomus]